ERQRALAPKLKLGVAQANAPIPQGDPEAYARQSLATLRALTRPLEARGVALTVWGESAYPYPLLRTLARAPEDVRAPLAEGVRGPLLLGLETYASFADNSSKYNSAVLVHPDGRLGSRVDKAHLIPFGEYVPFWHWVEPLQERFRSPGFTAGISGTVRTDAGKLGVLICYEDLFASAARETVRQGARTLVGLSNDVWFGHSREPFLHDAFARLRAVELRRDLLRAVNGGPSSLTTSSGASEQLSQPFTRASIEVEVALLDARTPYSRLGDLTAPACTLLTLLALARTRKLKPSRPAS
ncbi:MAG TPA: apolipoprotein N-acyltransferase, partial [Polyangiales bacterium]